VAKPVWRDGLVDAGQFGRCGHEPVQAPRRVGPPRPRPAKRGVRSRPSRFVASAFRQLGCWAYTVLTKRFRTIR
jgi:hypothetical protein